MNKKLNVLVLGVGGNVGQGILKALQISSVSHRSIGACVSPLACGLYTTEKSYLSPYYNDPQFFAWIIEICQTENIDVILTGVEPVLYFLAEHASKIKEKTGALCIATTPSILSIAHDKFLTCQWLEKNGFNYPRYALSGFSKEIDILVQTCGFPLIGKPRYGRGGSGIIKIENQQSLEYVAQQKDYLIQEYIGDPQSEYTVGCFSDTNGKVCGSIVMKRELLEGTTYRAEVGDFPDIRDEALRIVSALKPMGPCNLQFRLSSQGVPICFEINMRFSGTTPLRARFGFNEVQATLENYVLGQNPALPLVTKGIALRYWNEVYIDQQAYDELRSKGKLSDTKQFDLVIENWGQPQ